jgi:pyrroline-5-carboxylate reductase
MSDIRIGFIGAGNMASAIIKGAVEKKVVAPNHVIVYDIDSDKVSALQASHGVHGVDSISALCDMCDMLLMAVKPNVLPDVLKNLCDIDLPLISIAAGWSASHIKELHGKDKRVLRVMPNTPLMVGEGMSVFETPSSLNEHEIAFAKKLFSALGKVSYVQAKQMDAVTAVSGSGPAYVFMFIEALADGGVLCGLPRAEALTLAAQTVLGSAKMLLDTGTHPGALKDAVCSPGGTTIEAVKALEQHGIRAAVIDAVEVCAKKSAALVK